MRKEGWILYQQHTDSIFKIILQAIMVSFTQVVYAEACRWLHLIISGTIFQFRPKGMQI